MPRTPSLLLVLGLAAAPLLPLAACGDDQACGPGDTTGSDVTATSSAGQIVFADFTSSPNNDCPEAGAPTSITIEAQQSSPTTTLRASLTLCLPRPDLIDTAPIDLADDSLVQIIDVTQRPEPGCLITLDRSVAAAGSITFTGFCGDGQGSEGYAIVLDGTVGGQLACETDGGMTAEAISVTLRGSAAVAAPR